MLLLRRELALGRITVSFGGGSGLGLAERAVSSNDCRIGSGEGAVRSSTCGRSRTRLAVNCQLPVSML